ncbi:hypothetical protein ACTHGU_17615 [Chitinophagaceae bacterium MMS25-I14]
MNNWKDAVLDSKDETDPDSVIYDAVTQTSVPDSFDGDDTNSTDNNIKGIFICDKKGNPPDRAGKDFFDLMNKRSGSILKLNTDTGEVTIKENSIPSNVISAADQSYTLAKILDDNTGHNASQPIKLRVDKGISNIEFDGYVNGLVDLEDFNFSGLKHYKNVMQAVLIYHFLYERTKTDRYEEKLSSKTMDNIHDIHIAARNAEVAVWNEMAGKNVSMPIEQNWTANDPDDPRKVSDTYIYKTIYYDNDGILIKKNNLTGKLSFSNLTL